MLKKVIFALILVIIIVLGILLPINMLPEKPKNSTTQGSNKDTAKPVPTLSISGAVPLPFEHLDFAEPSSLWVVVSKTRPLADAQYMPNDLVIPQVAGNDQKSEEERSVRAVMDEPLQALMQAARAKGFELMVASGYRSYSLQQQYYSNYVRTSGEAEANKFSARPGYSEHQTGLAVDLSLKSRECYLDVCFGDTPAGTWLKDNAHIYGFIVRYPADKTSVTGYQYEPWHLRYVGKPLAQALHGSGQTLDEIVPVLESTRAELVQKGTISE